jgi:hypothetical protein
MRNATGGGSYRARNAQFVVGFVGYADLKTPILRAFRASYKTYNGLRKAGLQKPEQTRTKQTTSYSYITIAAVGFVGRGEQTVDLRVILCVST